jgi:hypothetical protein
MVRWTSGKETCPPVRRQAARGLAVVAISGCAMNAAKMIFSGN